MSLIRFVALAVVLGLLLMAGLLFSMDNGLVQTPALSLPIVFFNLIITAITYGWVGASQQPLISGQRYLLAMVIRILLQLTVIVLAGLAYPASMVATAIFAVICHSAYLLLEVGALYFKFQK